MKSSTNISSERKPPKVAAFTSEPSAACMASLKQDYWPMNSSKNFSTNKDTGKASCYLAFCLEADVRRYKRIDVWGFASRNFWQGAGYVSASWIFLIFLEMDTPENWQSCQTQKMLQPANHKAWNALTKRFLIHYHCIASSCLGNLDSFNKEEDNHQDAKDNKTIMPTMTGNGCNEGGSNAMTTVATMQWQRQKLDYINNCNATKIDVTIPMEQQ